MLKEIYNPLVNKNYLIKIVFKEEYLKDNLSSDDIVISEKGSAILKKNTYSEGSYFLMFKRPKKNIIGIKSNELSILELIYSNVLIVAPVFQEVKFYYYFNNKYKEILFSSLKTFIRKRFKNFNIITYTDKEFLIVEYEQEVVFFFNINDAMCFNEDLIENKEELYEKGFI